MSDIPDEPASEQDHSPPPNDQPSASQALPEDLPPIEPPSAGFIMQLFVVPAIIVAVIIGLWALFGRMVAEEENLTQVLAEIKSTNALRRGPSMHKLAQLMQVDTNRKPKERQFVNKPAVAKQTADLLTHWLNNVPAANAKKKEVLEAQIFLTRTLSMFETSDAVLPALQQSMHIPVDPKSGDSKIQEVRILEQDVRKSAIASIAVLANRANQQKQPLDHPALVADLSEIALDNSEDPTIRQVATYALGLFPGDEADEKLKSLLISSDEMLRLNAAIALSRKESTAGYDVFVNVFKDSMKPLKKETSTEGQK